MNLQDIKNRLILSLGGRKAKGRKSALLRRQSPDRIRMEMDKLNQAAYNALDRDCNDRLDLLAIYFNTWKDSQVISEHEKAEAFLITEPFEVRKVGSESVRSSRMYPSSHGNMCDRSKS